MVGLLPVAPHDGLGGRHHMVPHILRGACNVQLLVTTVVMIIISHSQGDLQGAAVGNDNHNYHDYNNHHLTFSGGPAMCSCQ